MFSCAAAILAEIAALNLMYLRSSISRKKLSSVPAHKQSGPQAAFIRQVIDGALLLAAHAKRDGNFIWNNPIIVAVPCRAPPLLCSWIHSRTFWSLVCLPCVRLTTWQQPHFRQHPAGREKALALAVCVGSHVLLCCLV